MTRRPKAAVRMRRLLDQLELTQMDAARFLRVAPRSMRRWVLGEVEPPFAVTALLEVMAARRVSPEAVERLFISR